MFTANKRVYNIIFFLIIFMSALLSFISTPYILENSFKFGVKISIIATLAAVFTAFSVFISYLISLMILRLIVKAFGEYIEKSLIFMLFIKSRSPTLIIITAQLVYFALNKRLIEKDIMLYLGFITACFSQIILFYEIKKNSFISIKNNFYINLAMFLFQILSMFVIPIKM